MNINLDNFIVESELRRKKLQKRKEVFSEILCNILDGNAHNDFKERLRFFLELENADIDRDFIVNCVCDSSYLNEYIEFHCSNALYPHILPFMSLIKDLQQLLSSSLL